MADIAQSGKARMAGVSGSAINPELVAQKDKARLAIVAEASVVQNVRCAPSQG